MVIRSDRRPINYLVRFCLGVYVSCWTSLALWKSWICIWNIYQYYSTLYSLAVFPGILYFYSTELASTQSTQLMQIHYNLLHLPKTNKKSQVQFTHDFCWNILHVLATSLFKKWSEMKSNLKSQVTKNILKRKEFISSYSSKFMDRYLCISVCVCLCDKLYRWFSFIYFLPFSEKKKRKKEVRWCDECEKCERKLPWKI